MHTPGPWEARPAEGQIVLNGSAIYAVRDVPSDRYNPDDIRLMAAAPELLAALRVGLLWSEDDGYDDDSDMVSNEERAFRVDARAAIAKAEGRSDGNPA